MHGAVFAMIGVHVMGSVHVDTLDVIICKHPFMSALPSLVNKTLSWTLVIPGHACVYYVLLYLPAYEEYCTLTCPYISYAAACMYCQVHVSSILASSKKISKESKVLSNYVTHRS
jgi:hypothetical protein